MTTQASTTCPLCKGSGAVNTSGGAATCPLCDGTGKIKKAGLKYQYATTFTLLANAQAQNNITVVNAPFRWMFALAVSTGAFLVQITDAQNNRQFFNLPAGTAGQHSSLAFGTAQLPFPITPPYTFPSLGTIQVNVTDISGAGNTIWIGFDGQELVDGSTSGQ